MKPRYEIVKLVFPEGNPRPYILLETMSTLDGPRTRVCEGRWFNIEDAIASYGEKQQELGLLPKPIAAE